MERPHDGAGIPRRLQVDVDGRRVAVIDSGRVCGGCSAIGHLHGDGPYALASSPPLVFEPGEDQQVRVEVALPFSTPRNMVRRPRTALTIRRIHANVAGLEVGRAGKRTLKRDSDQPTDGHVSVDEDAACMIDPNRLPASLLEPVTPRTRLTAVRASRGPRRTSSLCPAVRGILTLARAS